MRFTMLLITALLLVGCINRSNVGIKLDGHNQNVVLGNELLKETLTFTHANTHMQGNRMIAQVILTSNISEDQTLEYRFNWYNLQGLEVDNGQSPWRQFIIYAGASKTLEEEGLSPNAKKFRVSLRSVE